MAKVRGKVSIIHENCKVCDICVYFCPVDNLKIIDGELREFGKCTGCMLCENNCPDFAIWITRITNGEKKEEEAVAEGVASG